MLNKSRFQSLTPFISLGVSIALAVGLLILLFHVLVWGVVIGAILWLGFFIKQKITSMNHATRPKNNEADYKSHKKHQGITIDHDKL